MIIGLCVESCVGLCWNNIFFLPWFFFPLWSSPKPPKVLVTIESSGPAVSLQEMLGLVSLNQVWSLKKPMSSSGHT